MNDNDRDRLYIEDLLIAFDPAGIGVVLAVDDLTPFACVVDSTSPAKPGWWKVAAHTTAYFAGPAVPVADRAGATVLDYGRHTLEVRVTKAGSIASRKLDPLVIRP